MSSFEPMRHQTLTPVPCTIEHRVLPIDAAFMQSVVGGKTPYMKGVGMLVGNFELNP